MNQPYQRNTENLKRVILHEDGTYTDVTDVLVISVEKSYFADDGQMLLNGKIYKRKAKVLPDGSNSLIMGHGEAKDIGVVGERFFQPTDKTAPIFKAKNVKTVIDAPKSLSLDGIGFSMRPAKFHINVAPGFVLRYKDNDHILLDNSLGNTDISLVLEGENS